MLKTMALTLTALVAGCGAAPVAKAHAGLQLSAWLVSWDPESMKSFEANAGRLARVYPEFISCGEDGLPVRLAKIEAGWMARVLKLAHAKGAKVLATMNNYGAAGFDKARVQRMLASPDLMKRHIAMLLAIAKEEGLDGLDVDYELLEAKDRAAFSAFVTGLSLAAHARGLLVGIAVHPKDSEPGSWDGPQAQDYAALGRAVDYFHVMTYDYHWQTSEAGSLAPPDWVRKVMAFAAAEVPKAKLEMGLNSYGYDWQGKKGVTMTWPEWAKLAAAGNPAYRDPMTRELIMRTQGHEIWYPDAEAYMPKIKAAKELGLLGGAMWVLGQEDPAFWAAWEGNK